MVLFLRFLQWIFGFIFQLSPTAAIYLMPLAGEITYQIARLTKIKKSIAKNILLLLPGVKANLLADKLLKNVSYSIFEVLCIPFFDKTHLEKICKIERRENLDLGLSQRKGALVLAMHTGNYELTPILLSSLGYKMNSILKASADPLFEIINRSRSYKGTKLINVLETDMYRESLKALAENESVYLLIDTGALESRHEMITFLDRKVPAATGWLTLAQRSQAAVVPSLSQREGKKTVITFGEPLTVSSDNRDEVMHKVRKFYENFIQNHPEQWAIFLNEHEVKRMIEGK